MTETSKLTVVNRVALALAGIALIWMGLSFAEHDAAEENQVLTVLHNRIDSLERANERLRDLSNIEIWLDVETRAKDSYFRYMRIGREDSCIGYVVESDLPMTIKDMRLFDWIHRKIDSAGVDQTWSIITQYGESRVGKNTKHSRNRDGSIDGSRWGINSTWGLPGNEREATYKAIELYYAKGLHERPLREKIIIWVMGETRAKKAGLI